MLLRKSRYIIILCLSLVLAFMLYGCTVAGEETGDVENSDNAEEVDTNVQGINYDGKTVFEVLEAEQEPPTLQLTVLYKDGREEKVTLTEDMYTEDDNGTLSKIDFYTVGEYDVCVKYKGVTSYLSISVVRIDEYRELVKERLTLQWNDLYNRETGYDYSAHETEFGELLNDLDDAETVEAIEEYYVLLEELFGKVSLEELRYLTLLEIENYWARICDEFNVSEEYESRYQSLVDSIKTTQDFEEMEAVKGKMGEMEQELESLKFQKEFGERKEIELQNAKETWRALELRYDVSEYQARLESISDALNNAASSDELDKCRDDLWSLECDIRQKQEKLDFEEQKQKRITEIEEYWSSLCIEFDTSEYDDKYDEILSLAKSAAEFDDLDVCYNGLEVIHEELQEKKNYELFLVRRTQTVTDYKALLENALFTEDEALKGELRKEFELYVLRIEATQNDLELDAVITDCDTFFDSVSFKVERANQVLSIKASWTSMLESFEDISEYSDDVQKIIDEASVAADLAALNSAVEKYNILRQYVLDNETPL